MKKLTRQQVRIAEIKKQMISDLEELKSLINGLSVKEQNEFINGTALILIIADSNRNKLTSGVLGDASVALGAIETVVDKVMNDINGKECFCGHCK